MNILRAVSIAGLSLAATIPSAIGAQAAAKPAGRPPLQAGISVHLPVTRNAVAMPDADRTDALVVAVTAEGTVYLGIQPISPGSLVDKVKSVLASEAAREVYLKADGRAAGGAVAKIMAALRVAGVRKLAILTSQRPQSQPAGFLPPMGLEVWLHEWPGGGKAVAVELLDSGQRQPSLTIGGEAVRWADLRRELARRVPKGGAALVRASENVPLADVVEVADASRSVGALVVITLGPRQSP
jgi:biopolymer transport protein ExbD